MKVLLTIGIVLWLTAVGYGLIYLGRYGTTPGERQTSTPVSFPIDSNIKRDEAHATLLFFAHPKCPCSKASLNEISRLMPEVEGRLSVFVVLSKPAGSPADWTDTALRTNAEKIPGVKVVIDENEIETDRFSARTSGTALLYDKDGILRFQGGVTRVRGQEGDNAGRSAIADIVNNNSSWHDETSVFGCPIQDPQEAKAVPVNQ
jgi:hypothetical protein